jgi:hypothetical protein
VDAVCNGYGYAELMLNVCNRIQWHLHLCEYTGSARQWFICFCLCFCFCVCICHRGEQLLNLISFTLRAVACVGMNQCIPFKIFWS